MRHSIQETYNNSCHNTYCKDNFLYHTRPPIPNYYDVFNVFIDTLSFSSLYTIMKEDYQNGGQKYDDWAEASIYTISKGN